MPLAHSIVNKCLGITAKDNVTIFFYSHNLSLAEDIADECFKKGADVLLNVYTDRFLLSYMKQLSVESLRQPSVFCRALTENSSVEIWMGNTYDPSVLKRIAPEKNAAVDEGEAKAHWPLSKERKVKNLGVRLAMVTKPRAKTYGFNYAAWSRMMNEAAGVDYDKLAETGRRLREGLRDAKTIRVTGPGGTDLSFDVSGRTWRVSDGVISEDDIREENFSDEIPAGNIYVAPLEESAQGRVAFDVKTPYMGRNVNRLQWTFRDGKVVEFAGDSVAKKAREFWEKSTGDKDRIGYFAIGFNPKAKTGYTINNVASGAVSIGVGGNEDLGGTNKPGYFFVDTLSGATVEADGRAIVKNGVLQGEFTAKP
jgi:leucyl aminopeptidase (aminopeptidase T)